MFPQLDGLRAIAVVLVLFQHYLPGSTWVRRVGPGGLGVSLFFVLSGFLITGILLDSKEQSQKPLRSVLQTFYFRRFIRIFPLYYAVLFLTALLDVPPVRATAGWHLAYLSNFYFAQRCAWEGPTTPLWSLAIEEQFYLLWPFAVLSLSSKQLLRALVVLVGAGPLLRLLYLLWWPCPDFVLLLPFGNTDLLFLGALFALCLRAPEQLGSLQNKLLFVGRTLAFPALLLSVWLPAFTVRSVPWYLLRMFHVSIVAFASLVVVAYAAQGIPGFIGRFLEARPVAYVGKISYGIYLQHTFVHFTAYGLWKLPGFSFTRPYLDWLRETELRWFPIAFLTVLATASLSWFAFEKPINGWKDRFRY